MVCNYRAKTRGNEKMSILDSVSHYGSHEADIYTTENNVSKVIADTYTFRVYMETLSRCHDLTETLDILADIKYLEFACGILPSIE